MLTTRWVDPSGGSVVWQDDFQHIQRILKAAGMNPDPRHRYVTNDAIVFALDGDAVVGVARGRIFRDGFNDHFGLFELLPGPQAMLDRIAVLPEAQGRGVGRLLVRKFAACMSSEWGATHVALWVDQSPPRERRVKFFELCSFRSIEGSDDDLLGVEISTLLEVTAP